MWHLSPAQFLTAAALDLLLGDPHGWPHLVRAVGALSNGFEILLARFFGRTIFAGLLFWLLVTGLMIGTFALLHIVLARLHPALAWGFDTFVVYQTVAATDLRRHVVAVASALRNGDLPLSRRRLSMIVGRDTADLGESEIARATIESVAESLNDGIIAPLFWAALGGAPTALLYRTANTLDSTVGHRTERQEKFGKVSARLDDALNWIPARITALLFWLLNPRLPWRQVAQVITEARTHASPNAGWSEAAMAHTLGLRLGGTNLYHGEPVTGPLFNAAGRAPSVPDIDDALKLMWQTSALFLAFCLLVLTLTHRTS